MSALVSSTSSHFCLFCVTGPLFRGILTDLPLPPTIPCTFSELYASPGRRDYERQIGVWVAASLERLSGGDVVGLMRYVGEKHLKDFALSSAVGDTVASKVVGSLVKIQQHFQALITPATADSRAVSDDSKHEEKSNVVDAPDSSSMKFRQAQSTLQVLHAVFATTDLTFSQCAELGSITKRTTFFVTRKKVATESLACLSTVRNYGRAQLNEIEPAAISQLAKHLRSAEISTPSNTRSLRNFEHVFETHDPPYIARAKFDKIKAVTEGGGAHIRGTMSLSAAYKYRPRDVVRPQQESMRCSDHIQRKNDISFLHANVPSTTGQLNGSSVGPLSGLIGTHEEFSQTIRDLDMSRTKAKNCLLRYERLSGTQLHHTHNIFQQALSKSHRVDLPELSASCHTDFGQNGRVGMRKIMSEATERNLAAVTVFAMTFAYRLPDEAIQNIYVCILSDNLTHSAWNATCYMRAALALPCVSKVLKQMKTLHSWSDNGSHLACLENSTFWMVDFPNMYPNIALTTSNFFTSKHGKSSADLCVRLFNDNVRVLETTLAGWVNPKAQMHLLVKIRSDINKTLVLRGKAPVKYEYIWCTPRPAPLKYFVLNCDTMDISSCRKVLRMPDGDCQIQECIRYDVSRGAIISNTLVEKTRIRVVQKMAQPVPIIDHGVCSVARQAQRHSKRKAFLAKLSLQSDTNLDFVSQMHIPDNFDHRNMPALAGVKMTIIPKRGVGRSPSRPQVRSRKRKHVSSPRGSPRPPEKFRHTTWDLDLAVQEVRRIALKYNETIFFPTKTQFVSENQSYLHTVISRAMIFGISRKAFEMKVGLKWHYRGSETVLYVE